MALTVTNLKRRFIIDRDGKEIELSDPNTNLGPDEILKHYMPMYPELTNARIEGPKVESGKAIYTFTTEVGTHG